MIGKILLHIGKNPSEARRWQKKVVLAWLKSFGYGGKKILQFFPSFKLGNSIFST